MTPSFWDEANVRLANGKPHHRHAAVGRLADLQRRLDEAVNARSARAAEKQHAKGRKSVRERVLAL